MNIGFRLARRDALNALPRIRRVSPRSARSVAKIVPVISGTPGVDVWFLRFAIAFLAHLERGGHVADRLHARIAGEANGPPFNYDHVVGGPLCWLPQLVRSGHLFIGCTVCPGFGRIADRFPWWSATQFCAPGYDYFHDGTDCAHVPVDMAPHAYVAVSVGDLDVAAWKEPAQRAILVYLDPIEQAAFYYRYCRARPGRGYGMPGGRRIADWAFRDYLFQHALPSYAKLFLSYQAMAAARPGAVSLVPQRRLIDRPAETLAAMLSHLSGRQRDWPMIQDAVGLARREHRAVLEIELGRSLDGTRRRRGQRDDIPEETFEEERDPSVHREALAFLGSLGIETGHFAPCPAEAA